MTLDECRENIGRRVVYTPQLGGRREDGVIQGVSSCYAFVRYAGDFHSKATDPHHLTLLVTR